MFLTKDQEKIIINSYVLNLQRKKRLNMGFISLTTQDCNNKSRLRNSCKILKKINF